MLHYVYYRILIIPVGLLLKTQPHALVDFQLAIILIQVRELVPESQAYMDLLAFEQKLDATITRKRLDIQVIVCFSISKWHACTHLKQKKQTRYTQLREDRIRLGAVKHYTHRLIAFLLSIKPLFFCLGGSETPIES